MLLNYHIGRFVLGLLCFEGLVRFGLTSIRAAGGICEDVRHFSQHSNNFTINSQNSQLTLHTDSHATDSGAAPREGRTILGAQAKPLYCRCTVKCLYLGNRSE